LQRREFCASLGGIFAGLALPAGWARASDFLPVSLLAAGLNGGEVRLSRTDLSDLHARLRGELLFGGSPGYEQARRVWNGMIDRRPALIARCDGAADVRACVNFARENGLLTAIRGGGHGVSGNAVCEGGLMIDLAPMNHVQVDPRLRTATVAPGVLLGALDHESQAFGLATTAGTVSHTGAAGLTLGGGFGRLGRKFGLACDNLIGADLVTADGELVRVSDRENSDLMWGLRGGGGNFGVVTSFRYRLHPVGPQVLGGNRVYPLEQAREVLRYYAELSAAAPDELCVDYAIVAPPGARPLVITEVTWAGDAARGEEAIAGLRSFGKPHADRIGPVSYARLQRGTDAGTAPGRQYYLKSGFLRGIEPGLIDELLEGFAVSASRALVITFQQLGGAIGRIGARDTAFAYRDASHALLMMSGWTDPGRTPEHMEFVRDYWGRLQRWTQGFYVNSYTPDEAGRVRANFRENYPRLLRLKQQHDPHNLFRMNVNIDPAAAA